MDWREACDLCPMLLRYKVMPVSKDVRHHLDWPVEVEKEQQQQQPLCAVEDFPCSAEWRDVGVRIISRIVNII